MTGPAGNSEFCFPSTSMFPSRIHVRSCRFYLFSELAILFPQVDAMLLRFVPRVTPLIDAPFVVVEQVVKANFSEKRKTIRNSLR